MRNESDEIPELPGGADDDFVLTPEEIAEIDRVLGALSEVMDKTGNEMVLEILESACYEIAELLGEEEDDDLAQAA